MQILDYVSGDVRLQLGGTASEITMGVTGNGIYTKDYAGSNSSGAIFLLSSTTLNGSIDNIHIYELPDYTSVGNHSLTYSTADKYAGTGSLKITATGAGRGSELVTNPNISGSATGWTITVPAVVAYGNDNLVCTNLNNSSTVKPTGVTVTAGKTYEVIFTVTVTSGNIAMVAGVGATGRTNKTVSGTYRELQTCVNTGDFYVDGDNFYGTIESLSVKEYLGEVSLPSANLESCVATKKYTLEGFARLDASSLTFGSDLASGWNFTSGWTADGATINSATQFTTTGGNNRIYFAAGYSGMANKIVKIVVAGTVSTGTLEFRTGDSTVNPKVSGTFDTTVFMVNGINDLLQLKCSGAGAVVNITKLETYGATPITLTAQLGTKSVTSSALSIVAGTFTKFVLNFEWQPADVTAGQDLKLWLSGAGSVYVDKLSLTQSFDVIS